MRKPYCAEGLHEHCLGMVYHVDMDEYEDCGCPCHEEPGEPELDYRKE